MSIEEHAAHADPEFFPENVEFLGFVGGWDCYTGVDAVQILKDLDWLEVVKKLSSSIVSRNCVMSIPRHGSKREAAARLLDAHVRPRVHYEWPVPPYQSGLLTNGELQSIVGAIAEELACNSRVAAEKQCRQEAAIIKMARELGLDPHPAGHNDSAWMAGCPQSGSHWIMISPASNEFGCGYCRRKGGPQELLAFYDAVRSRSIQS
jgi:hypothetical protein